jgi:hypothetical protein
MVTRHLGCSNCGSEFDYDFVPGVSATSFRLGNSRYMRCPLCRKFGIFSLARATDGARRDLTPGAVLPSGRAPASDEPLPSRRVGPRFNDRGPLFRWLILVVAPALALILSGAILGLATTTEGVLFVVGLLLLVIGSLLSIGFALPDRVP